MKNYNKYDKENPCIQLQANIMTRTALSAKKRQCLLLQTISQRCDCHVSIIKSSATQFFSKGES